VDPVPDPLLLRKSGSAVNRTRTYGSAARNYNHYTTGADTGSSKLERIRRKVADFLLALAVISMTTY
jgi:hypothetical protein